MDLDRLVKLRAKPVRPFRVPRFGGVHVGLAITSVVMNKPRDHWKAREVVDTLDVPIGEVRELRSDGVIGLETVHLLWAVG